MVVVVVAVVEDEVGPVVDVGPTVDAVDDVEVDSVSVEPGSLVGSEGHAAHTNRGTTRLNAELRIPVILPCYDDDMRVGGVALPWSVGLLICVGCPSEDAPPPSDDSSMGSGIPTGPGTATDSNSATETGSGTDSNSGGGVKFDLGQSPGADLPPEQTGCDKVDVVFSIDNSGSMQEEIDELAGPVFDSFPAQLLAVNGGLLDFHLAVIDACNAPPHYHNWGDPGDCNFGGDNYMVSSDPTLQAEYSCVTQLNATGYNGMADMCSGSNDDEQPANTAADAVSLNGGANAGFLRDDAVLFVVAITDEDETPLPAQTPQQIADKIINAKGGIENVVFLGIGGDSDCDGPYGSADEASTLRDVTNIFVAANRGIWWDLCMGDLEDAFTEVIQVVDVACSEFGPEG